jgi:hypothetical protein
LSIKQADYTNLSIRQDTLITEEERKPISKSAMKILIVFGLYIHRYPLASKRNFDKSPLNAKAQDKIQFYIKYEVEDKWKVYGIWKRIISVLKN